MRDFAADAFGKALARLLARPPHQLDQGGKGLDPTVGTTALLGEFVSRLFPGHVYLAD